MKLDILRQLMADNGIDAVIIPQTDPHQSEYIADHWQVRRYLSGFTGSAGSLVVTRDQALLWTDSRYFIQAAQQLDGTGIVLMRDGLPETPSIEDYIIDHLAAGSSVGIDGMLFSTVSTSRLIDTLGAHGIKLVTDFDVTDSFWPDRPALPKDLVFVHDVKYAGQDARSKLDAITADAARQGADAVLVSALDEVAWALNIRCRDVKYNPVATSYLYVAPGATTLFIDGDKLSDEVRDYLTSQGVAVAGYDDIKAFVAALPADVRVLIEAAKTSATIANLLGDRAIHGSSPVALPKGRKNQVQIEGFRDAMIRDGVALVRAFIEVERSLADGRTITEMDVARILYKYRSQQELFFDESFGTIAAYGPHGAIVHYEADEDTDVPLQPHGLLLVDSGAQYLDGTTDITRTICLGTPTAQEMHDFTLVMKGCIALDTMVFPVGTRGVQLDVEARKFLWREGLGYLHGTGHGIGHFLNVHEGPQSVRMQENPVVLEPGMITSDEPGLYRENVHGIRCENLVLCVPAMTTECGDFLKFETLTLYPFDRSLMQLEIMTPDEIAWVDNYHRMVYDRLSPHLDAAEAAWLADKTAPLGQPQRR